MDERSTPVLVIGPDIVAYGLAAALCARGVEAMPVAVAGRGVDPLAAIPTGVRPAAIIVDLIIARRDDFAFLRRLRDTATLVGVPVIVSSSGTIAEDRRTLEYRLRAFGTRPLLDPHELDAILGELYRTIATVA